jgi:hypothetical protein
MPRRIARRASFLWLSIGGIPARPSVSLTWHARAFGFNLQAKHALGARVNGHISFNNGNISFN